MAQINVILWDVDGTLLDFSAAERRALEDCFRSFQMGPCTPELLARYSQINRTYWRRLERGELTKPQVLLGRFEEFFAQEGLNCRDIPAFNQEYQLRLGDTVVFRDDAGSLVARLKGRVRQYAVTNGTRVAQERKLSRSGLDRMQMCIRDRSRGLTAMANLYTPLPLPAFTSTILAASGAFLASSSVRA